jgi:dTDP-4-amino-4,6-dideoxygalactose transaminase
MTELQAAVLLAQLGRLDELTARPAANATYLERCLQEPDGPVVPLPRDPRITRQAYYYLGLRYRPERTDGVPRERFVAAVQAEGVPLEGASPVVYKRRLFRPTAATSAVVAGLVGRGLNLAAISCPNAEHIAAQTGLALEQHALLGAHTDVDDVVAAIARVSAHAGELAAVTAG